MLNRILNGIFFAFLLTSLGITSPAQARDAASDPDGGDEIAVLSDPDGGDEAVKGTKGTINVTVGAVASGEVADDPDGGDEIAPDPDGGDEISKVRTSDKKHAETLNYIKS